MLYGRKPLNENAVQACITKANRRKGKTVPMATVPDGALVRHDATLYLVQRSIFPGDGHEEISIYGTGYMLGYERIGWSWPATAATFTVQLLMGPDEVVAPKFAPDVETFVTIKPDGSVECQNLICGLHLGQKFSFPNRAAWNQYRTEEPDGFRVWHEPEIKIAEQRSQG